MRIVVSDLHIPYTDQSFLSFAEWVSRNKDVSAVIFNGDIVDSVKCTPEEILANEQGKKLVAALTKIIKAKECFFVEGNHDPELGKTILKLTGHRVHCGWQVCLPPFMFMHGHQFDPICRSVPWKLLKKIAPFFFKTPGEWKHRNREKFHKSVALTWAGAAVYLEKTMRNWDVTTLIIGHTHYPAILHLEQGVNIGDSGDFLDSRSYLALVGDRIFLNRWEVKR